MAIVNAVGAAPSIQAALRPLYSALFAATTFSLGINLLMLVSPLYLMQVFDRVLTSGNLSTLFWLTVVAIGSLAVYGALEVIRGRVLSKVGLWLECELTSGIIRAELARARQTGAGAAATLRDLGQVRGFLSGPAVHALFDAPWAIVFLVILWSLHSWYGVFALVSMVVLLALALVGELLTRGLSYRAEESQKATWQPIESALRGAGVVHAMGMVNALLQRWGLAHGVTSRLQNRLNDQATLVSGIAKFLRISVQTAVIAIGVVLAIEGEASAGGIIAASILLGRALAPVDQAIGSWKQIISARSAWKRVDQVLRSAPQEVSGVRLPEPKGHLSVEDVSYTFPGASKPFLSGISFEVKPGESLAVVGPSASGKTLFCRIITGIVPPSSGHVRIDHADLATWHPDDLRPYVGYLPQEVVLFPGTVAENIARLANADSDQIVAAAKLADVHEMILRLPKGYQTDVGEFGHLLSGGQRQRIGLARALFGSPRLVVLDEPNSNLDHPGEIALLKAVSELKKRGCSVVIVTHKLHIVRSLDRTMLLQDGAIQAFGPSDKILSIMMGEVPAERPLRAAESPSPQPALGSAHS